MPTGIQRVFTDGDIQKLLKSVDTNYELPEWQKNIRALVARLEAAEKALKKAGICHRCQDCYCQELNDWLVSCGVRQ